MKATK